MVLTRIDHARSYHTAHIARTQPHVYNADTKFNDADTHAAGFDMCGADFFMVVFLLVLVPFL